MKLLLCLVLGGLVAANNGVLEQYKSHYHYDILSKEEWVNTFAIFDEKTKEFHVTIHDPTHKPTETAIRYLILETTYDTFIDKGFIPEDKEAGLEAGASVNYVAYDAQNTSKLFGGKEPGDILVTRNEDKYSITKYQKHNIGGRHEKVCTNCGDFDMQRSPGYWISPAWCEDTKQWVSLNYTHLMTSTDLIHWPAMTIPLGACLENDDEKLVFVEDIFHIAHPTTKKQVNVVLGRDYRSYESFYYFVEFSKTDIIVDCYDRQTFDFGADMTEIAVANAYQIIPEKVYILGMVSNLYVNESKTDYYPAPTLTTIYPRVITLKFLDGVLRLNILPVAGASTGKSTFKEIVIKDKSFKRKKNLLKGHTSKSFKIKAVMHSPNATEFGLEVFSNKKHAAFVYYWRAAATVCLDRSYTALPKTTNPDAKMYYYYSGFCSPDYLTLDRLAVEVFGDGPVLEVFDWEGWFTITAVVYHEDAARQLATYTNDAEVFVEELSLKTYDHAKVHPKTTK